MVIKESYLRSIIRQHIRELINEGYSSKERKDEIVSIARDIYSAIIEQGQSTYDTSLKTKIDENSWSVTSVHAIRSKKERAYANLSGVTIEVTTETELNTIAKLLMHEFTHIFDTKKDKETRFMVSVKEWAQNQVEMLLKDAETEAEKNYLLKVTKRGAKC